MVTAPRLEACYFGSGEQGDRYERLARVLEHTAREHCDGWDVSIERLVEAELPNYRPASGNQSHVWNTWKLDHWRQRLLDAPDGEQVLLIDGDTMILRPLDAVWDLPFDVAYTAREEGRLPLNGGVLFLRVSDRTRGFMERVWEANHRFLGDYAAHDPWRKSYAGINQSAMGYVLEKVPHGCDVLKLLCSEWNCCEWRRFDPAVTRIVHVKSGLRRAVFGMPGATITQPKMGALVKLWHRIESGITEVA